MATYNYTIGSAADFNAALQRAAVGGADAGAGNNYNFNLTGGFTLDRQLFAINLQGGTAGGSVANINGGGATIDGNNAFNGLFVYSGNVNVNDLTIANAVAQGGAGGGNRGGGGAGLGGGLFVTGTNNADGSGNSIASGGNVTLTNVNFTGNAAQGGAGGGNPNPGDYGGGGGLGGAGGSSFGGNGGGGIGIGASGGASGTNGASGIVLGAASGGGGSGGGTGGANAGGGGTTNQSGGGGGVGGAAAANPSTGGAGGFGGGGGSDTGGIGGAGGFGGGGGGGVNTGAGGSGGFGGGGGSAGFSGTTGGTGGFGAGAGAPNGGLGGGGLGAGADVFVEQGGQLTIQGTSNLSVGTVTGGTGGTAGSAFGSGFFIQGNQSVTITPGAGNTTTVSGVIADQTGSGGTGANVGAGSLIIGAGTTSLTAANTYSGGTTIGSTSGTASSTLQLSAPTSAGTGAITFGSTSGTATARLGLNVAAQPASGGTFSNTIANFGSGNEIALAGLTNSSVSYNSANTSITVTGTRTGGGQVSENFVLSAPRTTSFSATSDGQGNTIVRAATPTPPPPPPPCYCTGTQILTDRGEVAVEALAIGDVVVTASGQRRPIRWIGNRSYIGRFANTNPAVLPVCMKAGALADGVPARDLWVSPDHALYLDGVLIPAEYLVNGTTIVKADRVESVTYWHIELDSHDVLLAEGAPAESFVDDGGRAIFHNAASYRALYPHQPVWPVAAVYCAERVTHGYALEAVRRRLALRAGLPVAPARVFGELLGHLDLCDGSRITGWAQDLAHPNGPVCLDIVVDGVVVALAYAETYRADLQVAGIGDGCHAFDLELPGALAAEIAHTVEVRRSADGAVIGSLRIEAAIAVAA